MQKAEAIQYQSRYLLGLGGLIISTEELCTTLLCKAEENPTTHLHACITCLKRWDQHFNWLRCGRSEACGVGQFLINWSCGILISCYPLLPDSWLLLLAPDWISSSRPCAQPFSSYGSALHLLAAGHRLALPLAKWWRGFIGVEEMIWWWTDKECCVLCLSWGDQRVFASLVASAAAHICSCEPPCVDSNAMHWAACMQPACLFAPDLLSDTDPFGCLGYYPPQIWCAKCNMLPKPMMLLWGFI